MSKFTSLKAINFKVGGYPGKKGLRHLALNKALELGLSGYLNYTPDSSALYIHIEGETRDVEIFSVYINRLCKELDLNCEYYYSVLLNCDDFLLVHDPENYNASPLESDFQNIDDVPDANIGSREIDILSSNKISKMIISGYNGIRRGLKHTGLF